jgi:hypothetical protein
MTKRVIDRINDKGELHARGGGALHPVRDLIAVAALVVGAAIFLFAWMLRTVPGADVSPYYPYYAVGMLGVAAVWLWMILRPVPVLEITRHGLRWTPWSDGVIAWQDIASMTARIIDKQPILETRLVDADRTPFRGHIAPVAGAALHRPFRGKADIIYLTNWPNCVFDDVLASVRRFAPDRLHVDEAFTERFAAWNKAEEVRAG